MPVPLFDWQDASSTFPCFLKDIVVFSNPPDQIMPRSCLKRAINLVDQGNA
ncbi:MAG: hypothetical protein F6K47_18050 [Symploca sp. SIO2E6]|nr:hypothetical protein [Symploca sp. SIO2E6]